MKIDTIIPIDQAQVAEVGTLRLGKYQVLGSWNFSNASMRTTLNGAPTVQPRDLPDDPVVAARMPGLVLEALPPLATTPTSIRLAIDPTLAPEGDE